MKTRSANSRRLSASYSGTLTPNSPATLRASSRSDLASASFRAPRLSRAELDGWSHAHLYAARSRRSDGRDVPLHPTSNVKIHELCKLQASTGPDADLIMAPSLQPSRQCTAGSVIAQQTFRSTRYWPIAPARGGRPEEICSVCDLSILTRLQQCHPTRAERRASRTPGDASKRG